MAFHVVGAGLAGLSAAVALACAPGTREVVLHEAAPRAGGRCRSWHDAALDAEIDNGTHALLGANAGALAYLRRIGAEDRLRWFDEGIGFLDLRDGSQWRIAGTMDLLRLWRRHGAGAGSEVAQLLRLLAPRDGGAVPAGLADAGGLGRLAWDPLVRSIMNASPGSAAAVPFAAALRRVLRGGRAAMRVGVARRSLADCFVDPALDLLARRGARLRFGARLRGAERSGARLRSLRFDGEEIALGPDDHAILALAPWDLERCLPGLAPPCAASPIVNIHVVLGGAEPGSQDHEDVALRGLVGGDVDWVLRRGRVASSTTSAATALAGLPHDLLFARLWPAIARGLGVPEATPVRSWRAIVERRATPLQDPGFETRRPGIGTDASNLLLAGDWVVPGLPCTIEGAIGSGSAAAAQAMRRAARARE